MFVGEGRGLPVAQPLGFRDALAQHDGREFAQALFSDAPLGGQGLQIDEASVAEVADLAQRTQVARHVGADFEHIAAFEQLQDGFGQRNPVEPEEVADRLNVPVSRVREVLKISRDPVSLDTPIGEEDDSHLGDFIEDDSALSPADSAAFSMLREELNTALESLTDRERQVVELRFGLRDGRARTLEEVGREFNVTRERIRQIEAKALRKLRHPSRSKRLKDFLI